MPACSRNCTYVPQPRRPVPPDLIRFALNALLVPLLDDSVPPRWTDVALEHICGPGTRVLIDGKPLELYSPDARHSLHRALDAGSLPALRLGQHGTVGQRRIAGLSRR